MQKILAFILTVLLMFNTLFGMIGEKYVVFENIRYGEAERDLVTLYVPDGAFDREENGCVLYIHGGSWTGGEKEDMAPHCKKLAMKGYIAATMSYSLCSDDTFGDVTVWTMLDEISLCIAAIRDYSDENGLNITKIATSGYSAGGHISMLYSYSRPEDAAIPLVFTANRVGPSDLTPEAWGEGTSYHLTSMLTGTELTAEMKENGEALRLAQEISPVYYVNEGIVPSIFAYAGNDPIVTKGNRESMVRVFEETFGEEGNNYRYIFYPASGHGLLLDPVSENQYDRALYDYCEAYFGY
ncbi:MAG: alpha/beta hydrolase [Clostridia bacterium]|nr:alpha/beta hydrolase [Clostridia bacterium]